MVTASPLWTVSADEMCQSDSTWRPTTGAAHVQQARETQAHFADGPAGRQLSFQASCLAPNISCSLSPHEKKKKKKKKEKINPVGAPALALYLGPDNFFEQTQHRGSVFILNGRVRFATSGRPVFLESHAHTHP